MPETIAQEPLRVLQLSDGKAGHENQAAGLLQALQAHRRLDVEKLSVASKWGALLRAPRPSRVQTPDLIIGAGNRTHFALLRCRQRYGGKAVVLMKPSLPLSLFDACIIPAHDTPPARDNVFISQGALNSMSAEGEHAPDKTIVLLGGPSKHYRWDNQRVLEQVSTIATHAPGAHLVLAGSRRTPPQLLDQLRTAEVANAEVVPVEDTGPGWLREQLAASAHCWVSPDSVSMVYEALTAGVAVGLLSLDEMGQSRVARGIEGLVTNGQVRPYDAWLSDPTLPQAAPINEAGRCAQWILERWPGLGA